MIKSAPRMLSISAIFQANILEKSQNITIVLLLMLTWRGIYHWEVVKETLLSNEKKNKGRGQLLS